MYCKVTTSTTSSTHHDLRFHDTVTVTHYFSFILANSYSFFKTQLKYDLLHNFIHFAQVQSLPFTMLSWYFANYVPVPCYTEYSSLLNYMGLNYAGLLTHNFLQYCTINECSIPNGFNIFSLAHFIIRNTVYKTYIYKICVS